ncbi:hypothetical protein JX266_014041 [Neoarthrinium moseri]|nr:hypothetical protein JX266_014041 [Neoarthrinium moseri]
MRRGWNLTYAGMPPPYGHPCPSRHPSSFPFEPLLSEDEGPSAIPQLGREVSPTSASTSSDASALEARRPPGLLYRMVLAYPETAGVGWTAPAKEAVSVSLRHCRIHWSESEVLGPGFG